MSKYSPEILFVLSSQATRKWWDDIQENITSDAARLVDNSFYRKYKENIRA
jgi:hypothetical protein